MEGSGWTLREVAPEDRRRYRSEGWWPDHSVGERMAAALARQSDQAFVIHSRAVRGGARSPTSSHLARRVASGLAAKGVGAGDVVTFQTPNWIEGVVTFYGAALLGAVAAPIVHIYGSRETAYILKQCQPKVHVTASRFGHQDFLANLESISDLPDFELVVTDDKVPSGSSRFSELVDEDPHRIARARRPRIAGAHRMDLGDNGQPEGSHPFPPDRLCRGQAARRHVAPFDPPHAHGEPDQSCHRHAGRASHTDRQGAAGPSPRSVGSGDSPRPDDGGRSQLRRRRPLFSHEPVGPPRLHAGAPRANGAPGFGGCSGPEGHHASERLIWDPHLQDVRLRRNIRRSRAAPTPTNSRGGFPVTVDHCPGTTSGSSMLTVVTCHLVKRVRSSRVVPSASSATPIRLCPRSLRRRRLVSHRRRGRHGCRRVHLHHGPDLRRHHPWWTRTSVPPRSRRY